MRSFHSVFQERLPHLKDTSNGSDLSYFTIKFALVVDAPGSTNPGKLQAKQAVTEETGVINVPRSTSAVGSVSGLTVDVNSDADKSQTIQAVTQATRAIVALGSTPASVNILSSVVDAASKVVSGAEAFDNTWGILLERIELFNKIVASIAEVL
jgi:hypothetical protein